MWADSKPILSEAFLLLLFFFNSAVHKRRNEVSPVFLFSFLFHWLCVLDSTGSFGQWMGWSSNALLSRKHCDLILGIFHWTLRIKSLFPLKSLRQAFSDTYWPIKTTPKRPVSQSNSRCVERIPILYLNKSTDTCVKKNSTDSTPSLK